MFVSSLSWMIMEVPDILLISEFEHDMKWVLSMYIIAEVTMLPLAGKLVDVLGSRRVITIGAAVFIIGAIACTFSNGEAMMVAARAVQGAGAGIAFAVALSTVGRIFPRSERGTPHEVMTAAFAFGSLYGAMIGYWFVIDSGLSFDMGWKATFYLEAVIMLVGWAIARHALPDQDEKRTGSHDPYGTLFLMVMIADLMTLSQLMGDEIEVFSVETLLMLLIAIAFAAIVLLTRRNSSDPVIPFDMNRSKAGCMLCMFLAGFCGLGMVQILMRFMLLGLGVSIYEASLAFLALLAGGACTSVVGLRKVNATGIRPWILAGPVLMLIGLVIASQTIIHGMPYVLLCMFILGLGLGCIVTEILCSIQGTTRVTDMGSVTSLTMSSRFIGILMGTASYLAILGYQVKQDLAALGEAVADKDIYWLVDHYLEIHDNAVMAFENTVETCCLVAGVLCVTITVVAYFMVGREDRDAPEFIGYDGEEASFDFLEEKE